MNEEITAQVRQAKQPMFNVPTVVLVLTLIMVLIQLVRTYMLSADMDLQLLIYFAFWPVRFDPSELGLGTGPGGLFVDLSSFVTYAFLHGSATHLMLNMVWMAIFGSVVARRFGTLRFLLLSAVCAAAGALMHLVFHFGETIPVIGASAAISGHMGAAVRFIWQLGGPLGAVRLRNVDAYRVPAEGLFKSLAEKQTLTFIVIWGVMNVFAGLGLGSGGGATNIAWQAHIGGFLAGLLLFSLFDPVPSMDRIRNGK
ncbi:MAG: rhomboid family intramembrane serine protease [Rhodobacteraceae bacterium]|nr:rhomboid family intramembrane serine protease [Paracoccaceae bacterium]